MMMGWGMGFGGLGFVFMALFWVVIIAAAIWLLGNLFPRSLPARPAGDTPQTAGDILKQRYARGEITREQFEVMRRDVEG